MVQVAFSPRNDIPPRGSAIPAEAGESLSNSLAHSTNNIVIMQWSFPS